MGRKADRVTGFGQQSHGQRRGMAWQTSTARHSFCPDKGENHDFHPDPVATRLCGRWLNGSLRSRVPAVARHTDRPLCPQASRSCRHDSADRFNSAPLGDILGIVSRTEAEARARDSALRSFSVGHRFEEPTTWPHAEPRATAGQDLPGIGCAVAQPAAPLGFLTCTGAGGRGPGDDPATRREGRPSEGTSRR